MRLFACLVLTVGVALVPAPAGSGAPDGPPWAAAARATPTPVGVWPLRPRPEVVADFAPPTDPWGAGHRGVDLAGTVGQPVHTALAGTVSFVGRIAGKAVVVVSHGDTRTTYEPVVATARRGQAVARGERIGTLELPASHCFPAACLHWGWLRGADYLDPLLLVGAGPVRLLPLWRDEPVDLAGAEAWRAALRHPYLDRPDPDRRVRLAGAPGGRPSGAGPW